MKGVRMGITTRAEAEAHQRKHGFAPMKDGEIRAISVPVPGKRDEMNKTERDYSFILEAMKRRGEIDEYRFQGMTLRWRDPQSGELMRYTPDFVVYDKIIAGPLGDQRPLEEAICIVGPAPVRIRMVEIKGGWIKGKLERAIERFRHARTVHPQFVFEMHQKKGGSWQRIH